MKKLAENDARLVRQLLITAKRLVAEEEDDSEAVDDTKMNEKIRNLRTGLPKLKAKGRKKLKMMGIEKNIMVSQATVEDLVDALLTMTTQGG